LGNMPFLFAFDITTSPLSIGSDGRAIQLK
jgi:hypothetical protein